MAVASSIIGRGTDNHIVVYIRVDHKSNRFPKKLILQNMNISDSDPPDYEFRHEWIHFTLVARPYAVTGISVWS